MPTSVQTLFSMSSSSREAHTTLPEPTTSHSPMIYSFMQKSITYDFYFECLCRKLNNTYETFATLSQSLLSKANKRKLETMQVSACQAKWPSLLQNLESETDKQKYFK